MKKALIVTAFIIIFALGLFSILMAMRRPWIEPLPGVRLTPTRPILLEKDVKPDSACDLLLRAATAAANMPARGLETDAMEELKSAPWSLEQASNTITILEHAGECLELARHATTALNPQIITQTSVTQALSYVGRAMSISRYLAMSAKVKTVQGDYAGAMKELDTATKFGTILTRGGALIHHLVGMACCGIARKTMRQIALNYPVHERLLRETSSFLQETENSLEPWAESVRHEALSGKTYADEFFRDPWFLSGGGWPGAPVPTAFKTAQIIAPFVGSAPTTMQHSMEACYTHLVSMAEKLYDAAAYDRFDAMLSPANPLSLLASRDPVGRMLASMTLTHNGSAHARYVRNVADLRATRVVFAIVMFNRAEGRLPQKLEELVPKYLDKVPDDPFDGKPMKYRVDSDTTWVLYSIGADQKDDGGIEDPDSSPGRPDIVFGPQEKPRE